MKQSVVLLFILLNCNLFAQTDNKQFLAVKLMPAEFQKQLKTVNSEFKFAYGMLLDSTMRDIRNYSFDTIHKFIYKETDYEKIFRCPFWLAMDSTRFCKFIPELINALTDTTYIGLTNANDVTIWCRVKAGQLKQNSLNYQIDDDIFRVCGRASWILKRLTKNEYGIIRCDTKMDDIKAIQKLWWKWLKTLKIK
jgi:hypothetical protein